MLLTTVGIYINIGDLEIDVFQVLRLKLSPPENDVLPLVFCEVTVVAKLCFCTPSENSATRDLCRRFSRRTSTNHYYVNISLQMLWTSALLAVTAGRGDSSSGEEQLATGAHTHFKHPMRVTWRSCFTHG